MEMNLGEIIPKETKGIENNENWLIENTLRDPTQVHVDASHTRAGLLLDAGCLSRGLDLADTVMAKNSIEKLLCHQLAAAHIKAMELLVTVSNVPPPGGTCTCECRVQADAVVYGRNPDSASDSGRWPTARHCPTCPRQ